MPEINSVIIAGLTMWAVEWCKRKGMDKFYAPVAAFIVAGIITVVWNYCFEPTVSWQDSLKQGLILGAITGGLYGFGKSVIKKSVEDNSPGN